MRAAIMQPYFFPYIGYWQLFFNCDVWVFFDSVQYNKKSWMNRNRILHPDHGKEYQYINVPVKKHEKGALIKDVVINNEERWKEKILGQLTVYRKLKAPYYNDVMDMMNAILAADNEHFVSLIIDVSNKVSAYLGENVKCMLSSELGLDSDVVRGADDWALEISLKIGADSYINSYGGFGLFDDDKYHSKGVDIKFLKPIFNPYGQGGRQFISGLSIIDVLMFNSKEDVSNMIKNEYQLLTKSDVMMGYS